MQKPNSVSKCLATMIVMVILVCMLSVSPQERARDLERLFSPYGRNLAIPEMLMMQGIVWMVGTLMVVVLLLCLQGGTAI
ncbi:hypothetical protein CRYUN_Cryun09bG0026600 [Craigia yunnanensis]